MAVGSFPKGATQSGILDLAEMLVNGRQLRMTPNQEMLIILAGNTVCRLLKAVLGMIMLKDVVLRLVIVKEVLTIAVLPLVFDV